MGIGDKAKLINHLDKVQADKASLHSIYTIEVSLLVSPKNHVKCGAIVIFKMNDLDMDLSDSDIAKAMKESAQESTDQMFSDPEFFREDLGQWIEWVSERLLQLHRQLGSADIIIKAPTMRTRERIPHSRVVKYYSNPRKLFGSLWHIDRLLSAGFCYDPFNNNLRRGRIGADKGGLG